MQLPDEAPKLPKLPFFIGDGLLIATAAYLAQRSDAPLPSATLIAIVACVAIGAVLAVIPFLIDYARRQEATLTDRQNSLETLARTTAAAAEQISIAASGMHTIGELVHKNLRAAEQLPHRLQEKINEFNQQRDEAIVAENEALTQEVNSLRASEAEKLESASAQMHKTLIELAKAEASFQKHLTALRGMIEGLPDSLDQASTRIGKAVEAAGNDTVARVLAEIDAHLAAAAGSMAARASFAGNPTATGNAGKAVRKSPPPAPTHSASRDEPPEPQTTAEPSPSAAPSAASEPPKEVPASQLEPPGVNAPLAAPQSSPAADVPPSEPRAASEPKPVPAPRKRVRKDVAEVSELPGLLVADEPASTPSSVEHSDESAPASGETGELERSLSADGVTRLTVTAYIGIGNRLFVRGEGPGLSRDKGVPLHFVSIGKWRWESPEATGTVSLRIFKNDQTECPGLGEITLEPGQQGEVTANF